MISSADSRIRSFNDATDGERRRRLLSTNFAADREKQRAGCLSHDGVVTWKQSLATYLSTLSLSDGSVEEAEMSIL